jgi:hypothetical protein
VRYTRQDPQALARAFVCAASILKEVAAGCALSDRPGPVLPNHSDCRLGKLALSSCPAPFIWPKAPLALLGLCGLKLLLKLREFVLG